MSAYYYISDKTKKKTYYLGKSYELEYKLITILRELNGDELILHSDEGSTDNIMYELNFDEIDYNCEGLEEDSLNYEQVDDIFIEFSGYKVSEYGEFNLKNVLRYLDEKEQ